VRRTSALWAVVVPLLIAAAPQAAAQDQATQDPPLRTTSAPAAVLSDSVAKVRKPGVGPELPDYVLPVSATADAKPAAPRGNIIIPVTTALIVLAALVVVLIIT